MGELRSRNLTDFCPPFGDLHFLQGTGAVAEAVGFHPHLLEEREVEIGHRRFLGELHVAAGLQRTGAGAGEEDGEVVMGVRVAVGDGAAEDDHRVVEHGAGAFAEALQFPEEGSELLEVKAVDLRDLGLLFGAAAVMREFVVALGDADPRVGAVAAVVLDHEGGDARGVGLEGEGEQVVHEPEVFGEVGGDAVGLGEFSLGGGGLEFRGLLDADFGFAEGGEVFVELAAVGRAEARLQGFGVGANEVEDGAAAAFAEGFAGGEIGIGLHAEEPLEDDARIEERGHRGVFVSPREVVLIGAGVAAVARAGLADVGFATQFQ